MKAGELMVTQEQGGDKWHRAVCVGVDDSQNIAFILGTSKIEKRKQFARKRTNLNSEESLVILKEGDYTSTKNKERCSLTKETCFDCNIVCVERIETIKKTAIPCDPLPDGLLKKIQHAVKMSPNVEEEMKERFKMP